MTRSGRVGGARAPGRPLDSATQQDTPSTRVRALVMCAALTGLVACASPSIERTPPALEGTVLPLPTRADSSVTRTEPPIVQVRQFPSSAMVSVVGWTSDETAYGLRAEVSRTGDLVGGYRRGDHRLYLTPVYVSDMGGFSHAMLPPGALLRHMGASRDYDACGYGDSCSPRETIGIGIPDSVLRTHRDSLVVMFRRSSASDWTITLRRELIDAYLGAVDSVTAALRRK